eukprot:TRINITY_DN64240_c0_g1_i1.p1 TRINITY_DN64240_c0_g1~~TRINITY_DN64240_c0_g1_i1.p1  ORF type:complete len:331 (-),score=72.54 TRINITY_DN64240_c0_g1_i1:72-1064(-)
MILQMSGVALVAELWGASQLSGALMASVVLFVVVFFGSYRQIEMIGITLGLCELAFVVSMVALQPEPREMLQGLASVHSDPDYMLLSASNVGAIIMPWMIYFQQNAVLARRLGKADIARERGETLIGSFLTQLVMFATVVTMAAAPHVSGELKGAHDFVDAMSPILGLTTSKILVSLAFLGGSLCAGFVVAVTPAWAISEALGRDEFFGLDERPSKAPVFYLSFFGVVACGFAMLAYGIDIVRMNIYIELLSSLLLPVALGFLYLLAISDLLPPHARVDGMYKWALGGLFSMVIVFGFVCGSYGMYNDLQKHQTAKFAAYDIVPGHGLRS